MSEKDLEGYFTKYGSIKNCKIAKDPQSGKSKSYGFVWFEQGKGANAAMLDYKAKIIPYTLDWYKILAQRSC